MKIIHLHRFAVVVVLCVGVAWGGAQSSLAAPNLCKRVGATKIVSAKSFKCVKNKKSGKLVWKRTPTTTTTTSTTTSTTSTIAVVVPGVLVAETMLTSGTWPKAVSVTSNVVGTVYLVEGASAVSSVADITRLRSELWMSAPITQVATPTTVAVDVDALTNGYYRVFVANASGVLSAVATNKVTISVTRACTNNCAMTVALTCATGGACVVGDTGPGGGIVFYVKAFGGTFTSTGSDCNTACKYLEAAPADQSAGIVWATTALGCYDTGGTTSTNNCQLNSIYSGDATAQTASRTAATAIGKGMANTSQIYARVSTEGGAATADYAAGIAWAYTNNGKTDWHLPSKDELNQMYVNRVAISGFSADSYWSSSEGKATGAWWQYFADGDQTSILKNASYRVRPVRAFG